MNNKEIEKNLINAFSKIQPNQIDAILSDCKKKGKNRMIFVEDNDKKYTWLPRLAMAATAFALVIGLIFGANVLAKADQVVAATISLDVNPSIEIKINKDEKVIDVFALNDDAKAIIGDMNFKGSDLKVTVNALIGSLVRNGYINELTNSILISVDDQDDTKAKLLEEELLNEISNLIEKGSVLAQQVKIDDSVKEIADKYGITVGKAQLVKELADKSTIYTYEDLAKLTINELNLLSKDLNESNIQRNGQPSDKAYIGVDKAKEVALADVGVSESQVFMEKTELDYEFKTMIYEIEFVYNNIEYEYVIDATTGDILYVDKENERTYTSSNIQTPTSSTTAPTTPNTNNSNVITEARAKEIAFANAGVSANQVSWLSVQKEYDDGVVKYEIDFHVGNMEYDYDVNATTGAILKAEKEVDDDYYAGTSSNTNYTAPSGTTHIDGDDAYKVENGQVYEYDDGRWEVENDKKVENGQVYEYDDGRWELDNDDDRDYDDDDDWDDDHDDDDWDD